MVLVTTIKVTTNKDRMIFQCQNGIQYVFYEVLGALRRYVDRYNPYRASLVFDTRCNGIVLDEYSFTYLSPSRREKDSSACLRVRVVRE